MNWFKIIALALCLWALFGPEMKISAQEGMIDANSYSEKIAEVKQYIEEAKYDKVLEQTLAMNEFLKIRKDLSKDSLDLLFAKNYYNLCYAYLFLEPEKSLTYADSSISRALKTTNPEMKQRAYSIKYYVLYDAEGEENTLDFIADECIRYALEAKNDKMLGESYMHKCNSLAVLGKPTEAVAYCNKAATTFEKISEAKYLSSVYNNMGNVFVKINDPKTALDFYTLSYEKSTEVKGTRDMALSARNMADQFERLGQWEKAATYHKIFGDSIESHYERLLKSNFTEAEAKFNFEQKDKEIAQQQLQIAKEKNTRNRYIFSAIALLLIAGLFFLWYSNKQKQKKLATEVALQKEQEFNELRTKLLGNIAHEIRTPLTLISGNLNLALEQSDDPKKVKKNIQVALENSKKITEDANDILALLKFEKGKTRLQKTQVPLNSFLKRVVLSFKSLAEMKEVSLRYQSTILDEYYALIDPEKTEKIINNLLSNAIKYSPSNKEVIVAAEVSEANLTLKVTDYGEGIHYDETEKIFERFYQSNKNPSIGGVGIGLSLSRELAELMDGSLHVESTYGTGCTFVFSCPVPIAAMDANSIKAHMEAPTPSKKVEKVPENPITSKTAKILIVEDNPEMMNYLVTILSPFYQCEKAFDGVEALERLKKETFHLITSDIMMPRMDGFALREAMNQLPNCQNVPFILISAKTLEEDKIRGFTLGIDDYIVKPFNKEELKARVKNLLANYQAREQWKVEHKELLSDTTSADQKLLRQIEKTIADNLTNEDFTITQLAEHVNYSQRQLTRIIKQYTGMTPVQLMLEVRLQKAYQLLQHKTHFTLSEVRYDVCISSSPYFNKKFKERFGIAPAELLS